MNRYRATDYEKLQIQDELSIQKINQLHNTTLNFSKQSFETKKLCVVTETAMTTLIIGSYNQKIVNNILLIIPVLSVVGFLIALLFYIVDAFTYYYQRKLRNQMLQEEYDMRKRYKIFVHKHSIKSGWLNAFFNVSHFMYFFIMFVFIVVFFWSTLNTFLQLK